MGKMKRSLAVAARSANRTKWLLVFYDVLIFLVLALLLLIYPYGEPPAPASIVAQTALAFVCIFLSRALWLVYHQIWRYGGIQSYILLLLSDSCAFVVYFFGGRLFLPEPVAFLRVLAFASSCLLCSLAIRMVYRYAYKCCTLETRLGRFLNLLVKFFGGNRVELEKKLNSNKISVAIIGAGRVGASFAEELLSNKAAAYTPKCFIDTNQEKIGRRIYGLPVLSELKLSVDQLAKYNIQEIIVALPQLSAESKLGIYDHYSKLGFKVKVYDYPALQQTGGRRRLREFSVEELLFRKPRVVTNSKTRAYYKDKTVLITGGGGSIGSELCRQIAAMSPRRIVILDIYENGAYDVQQELAIKYKKKLDIAVEIVSVCNRAGLERVFAEHRPQIVLHAAAHKHVPLMEHNCVEAVENNVFGTLNTVELSEKYRVERFIMVSTDKAVNPTNVMGATKRMCEMVVQAHSQNGSETTFSATRFGNVLGSAGSVIPLFKRQIAAGGPVTITDKRIIRYFMTIPEAAQLVLESGALAKNGELFVLDMGSPIRILDLAENMIRLSGMQPDVDIQIVETGLRPGEKLYEELLVKSEELDKTENRLIFIERDTPLPPAELREKLDRLRQAVDSGSDEAARDTLKAMVPTFRNPEEVNTNAKIPQKA